MADASDTDESGANIRPKTEWAEEELGRFLQLKHWTVEEAVHLLNGQDPWAARDLMPGDDPYVDLPHGLGSKHRDSDREARRQNIEGDLAFTRRYIAAAGIDGPRTPREFLTLAAENGHHVPWLGFARSRPKLRLFLPEGEEDHAKALEEHRGTIARLSAENEQLRRELVLLRPLAGKERVSVFRVLGGMARAGWRINLKTPETSAFQELLHDLETHGAKTSRNTLRKYLGEADEHVDGPPDFEGR
jgi:hypothetical protein